MGPCEKNSPNINLQEKKTEPARDPFLHVAGSRVLEIAAFGKALLLIHTPLFVFWLLRVVALVVSAAVLSTAVTESYHTSRHREHFPKNATD